jgi:hypothetical protein
VGLYHTSVHKKRHSHQKSAVSATACSQPEMKERKLRTGVNWQGAIKQKGVKQTGVKPGLGVHKLN